MTHGSFQYGIKWITPLFLRYKVLCPRVTPTLLRSTFLEASTIWKNSTIGNNLVALFSRCCSVGFASPSKYRRY